jgi:serine protease
VVTVQPKVYLVFWGSQWGTQSTSGGYQVFSGDPNGLAPYSQAFFAGLGTNGETWSVIPTQYCQSVAVGTTSCPPSVPHVAYPSGGVLAGVWEDTSYTPPTGPPGDPSTPVIPGLMIAEEAQAAAAHFGDTSPGAQYAILSPTGTNPDGWSNPKTGFCGYHDYTGDPYWNLSGANVPYTNFPYSTDSRLIQRGHGASCGAGFVNSPGTLDGVSVVGGHEYAETLTDPYPGTGWTDHKRLEIGDKCEYLKPTLPGTPFNLALATGSFPVQSLWANDAGKHGGCDDSHPIISVTNPGKQAGIVGSPASLQIETFDAVSGQTLSYSASGLPAGLSINPNSGLITGIPTKKGSTAVTINVSDGHNPAGSTVFKWTIQP